MPQTDTPDLPRLLTVEQFRRAAGIGRATAYQMIARGDIPCVRYGRTVRVPMTALLPQPRSEQGRR